MRTLALVALVLVSGCAGTTVDQTTNSTVTVQPTTTELTTPSTDDLDRAFYRTLRNETEAHVREAPQVRIHTSFGGRATETVDGREETLRTNQTRTVTLDREKRRFLREQTIRRASGNRTMTSTQSEYVTANRTYVRQSNSREEGPSVRQYPTENFTQFTAGALPMAAVLRNCLRRDNESSAGALLEDPVESIEQTSEGTTITYHNNTTAGNRTIETTTELRIDDEGWLRSCDSTLTSTGDSGVATIDIVARIETDGVTLAEPSWTANATTAG